MLNFLRSLQAIPVFVAPPWWERHWLCCEDIEDLWQALDYFLLWWREYHLDDPRTDEDILLSQDFDRAVRRALIRHPWYFLKCWFRELWWRLSTWFWEKRN